MAQRSRAIIAIASGLALAGLASLVVPSLGDSPAANAVSPSDEVVDGRPDARASLVRAALAAGPHADAVPARAVTVSFERGMLAIRARAAPLDEILAAVTRSVGVRFVGADDAREAVSIDAGPGPVAQVLSALLAGANYGFAFVDDGDAAAPVRPARVILLKQSATPQPTLAAPRRPPIPMPKDQAMPASADAPGVRQQQVLDELLDACKQQGCDTS